MEQVWWYRRSQGSLLSLALWATRVGFTHWPMISIWGTAPHLSCLGLSLQGTWASRTAPASLLCTGTSVCTEWVSRAGHKLIFCSGKLLKAFHSHTHSHTLASGSYTDSFGFSSWWVKGQEIKKSPCLKPLGFTASTIFFSMLHSGE